MGQPSLLFPTLILLGIACLVIAYRRPRVNVEAIQAQMLKSATGSRYTVQPLINRQEQRVYDKLCAEYPDHVICPQVSLGEILSSDDSDAYRAVNCKRVDFAIVRRSDWVTVAVVEFQGGGHWQGNHAVRDATKRAAVEAAGLRFIEVFPG